MWTDILSETQNKQISRIVMMYPELEKMLRSHGDAEFCSLVEVYMSLLEEEGNLTPGKKANLNYLKDKYSLYRNEYIDQHRSESFEYDFDLYSVLTWSPRPQWAKSMTVLEIDYLDHFIPKVAGLPEFLFDHKDSINLYDLVVIYQMKLNALGKNDPDIDFALETIKERFYRIMDDHSDAIHYVNHSHSIDDDAAINCFLKDANDRFYYINLEQDICSDFVEKYQNTSNPYISHEIFKRYIKANKANIALNFSKFSFLYIFSSPNIYWHNEEAIYGMANILYTIIDYIGENGVSALYRRKPDMAQAMIESLYLLLSRIIYWSDKETQKKEYYDEEKLPISIQHKLMAYRQRADLLSRYGNKLISIILSADVDKMRISDLYSAHYMAYANKIVGKNSVFLQDAKKNYIEYNPNTSQTAEHISEAGFIQNDELAKEIHDKYRKGKYCFSEKEITELISDLRLLIKEEKDLSKTNNHPIPYLAKDNYSPFLKKDKAEIKKYLEDNNIECFYHFTEIDKLHSIVKSGGLLSYKRCLDEAIVMPIREDMAISRDIDAQLGLEDYARLSFNRGLPKMKERQAEGAKLVMLEISTDVALFENTLFTNIEATHEGLRYGPEYKDLEFVKLDATKKQFCPSSDPDYLFSQAEILVKGVVPLKYIKNIRTPEYL